MLVSECVVCVCVCVRLSERVRVYVRVSVFSALRFFSDVFMFVCVCV